MVKELQDYLDDIFDNAIVRHGFTDYMRDYEIVVDMLAQSGSIGVYSYLFRGCVEAHYESRVLAHAFSMDDAFIDYKRWEDGGSPEGFVWGVKWADAYPGAKAVRESIRAHEWSEKLGLAMHEVQIETNVFQLRLVFHDLTVSRASVGAGADDLRSNQ